MGSTGRTMRGFLIEAVVIIASILLAFAIDAGWDEWIDRRDERAMLEALVPEFEANLAEAAGVIAVHERNGRLIGLAHARTPRRTSELPPDSVSATLHALASPRTFDAIRGTLDALIGSGQLELIRDPELVRALTVYLNLVEDSFEDAAYMGEGSRRVWDRQIRWGGPWRTASADITHEGCEAPVPPSSCFMEASEWGYLPEATPSDLIAVLADEELMGQVRQLQLNVSRYLAEVRRIERQVELVLSLLERNLE